MVLDFQIKWETSGTELLKGNWHDENTDGRKDSAKGGTNLGTGSIISSGKTISWRPQTFQCVSKNSNRAHFAVCLHVLEGRLEWYCFYETGY
jgi:hypothetical protein